MGAFAVPALLARALRRRAVRVVVVGAGVGGLAAAVRLARAGHAVTVLEQGAGAGRQGRALGVATASRSTPGRRC